MTSRFAPQLVVAGLLLLPGCIFVHPVEPAGVVRVGFRGGVPLHAPAHGYRCWHAGLEMTFDADLGVYVVAGRRGLWFSDGSYFRVTGDQFEIAAGIDGPWRLARAPMVPARLYAVAIPAGPGR